MTGALPGKNTIWKPDGKTSGPVRAAKYEVSVDHDQ